MEDDEELLFHTDRLLVADPDLPINEAIRRAAEWLRIKVTDTLLERVRAKYRRRKKAGNLPDDLPISRQFHEAIEASFAHREHVNRDRAKARRIALARAADLGLPVTSEADWQIALDELLHQRGSIADYGEDSESVLRSLQNKAATADEAVSWLQGKRTELFLINQKIQVLRDLLGSRAI